jgi:outer membrane protein TolC
MYTKARLRWACIAAFAVVLGASRFVAAQPSLAELDAAARARGWDNREAQALAERRGLEAQQAWQALLPSLSATGRYTRNQYEAKASIPASTADAEASTGTFAARNQWDLGVSLRLPLVDVARWRGIHLAELNARAESAQAAATQVAVARSVATTYYQLLGAQAVLLAAERTVEAAEGNVTHVGTQRGAGVVSQLDVLRARAEVESGRRAIAEAESTRATLVRSLETLTGLRILPPYAALPPDDLRAEAPLDSWLAHASSVPTAVAARHRASASEATAFQQRAALLPTLEAEATERFTNAPGFGKSAYYSVTVIASWQLDLATYTGSRAADAAAQAERFGAERGAAAARDAIHDAWHQVVSLTAKSRAARAQLDVSRQILAFTSQEYAAGTALLIDVIQAKRDAFSAEVETIRADTGLGSARAALRLAAGRSPTAGEQP